MYLTSVMNPKILIYSIVVSLTGVLTDATFAQTVPQQSAASVVTRSGRVRNPESIKRAKLTRLKKDVDLDEQQVQAITPIIDSYVTAVQNVKSDASLDSHARRMKLSELRKRYNSDVDALLKPEQQQKLASVKAERLARLRGARAASETSQAAELPETSPVSQTVQ
jgi:hypothetical protein